MLPYTSATDGNKLADEFLQYQLMNENDIPADIWESALTVQDKETRHYIPDGRSLVLHAYNEVNRW